MSRKLIFAAGLITCYSCDPAWVAVRDPELSAKPTVEGLGQYLETFVQRPPLDILGEVVLQPPGPGAAKQLLDAYDSFLAQLDDTEVRKHLKGLPPERAASDGKYAELTGLCDHLRAPSSGCS